MGGIANAQQPGAVSPGEPVQAKIEVLDLIHRGELLHLGAFGQQVPDALAERFDSGGAQLGVATLVTQ